MLGPISRRNFLKTAGTAGAALAAGNPFEAVAALAKAEAPVATAQSAVEAALTLLPEGAALRTASYALAGCVRAMSPFSPNPKTYIWDRTPPTEEGFNMSAANSIAQLVQAGRVVIPDAGALARVSRELLPNDFPALGGKCSRDVLTTFLPGVMQGIFDTRTGAWPGLSRNERQDLEMYLRRYDDNGNPLPASAAEQQEWKAFLGRTREFLRDLHADPAFLPVMRSAMKNEWNPNPSGYDALHSGFSYLRETMLGFNTYLPELHELRPLVPFRNSAGMRYINALFNPQELLALAGDPHFAVRVELDNIATMSTRDQGRKMVGAISRARDLGIEVPERYTEVARKWELLSVKPDEVPEKPHRWRHQEKFDRQYAQAVAEKPSQLTKLLNNSFPQEWSSAGNTVRAKVADTGAGALCEFSFTADRARLRVTDR